MPSPATPRCVPQRYPTADPLGDLKKIDPDAAWSAWSAGTGVIELVIAIFDRVISAPIVTPSGCSFIDVGQGRCPEGGVEWQVSFLSYKKHSGLPP